MLASLYSPKGRALRIIQKTQDLSEKYLALPQDAPAEERNRISTKIAELTQQFPKISEKHKEELIDSRAKFRKMVDTVHGQQQEFESTGEVKTPSPDLDQDDVDSAAPTATVQPTGKAADGDGPEGHSSGGSSAVR